jgi:hypothetical protein
VNFGEHRGLCNGSEIEGSRETPKIEKMVLEVLNECDFVRPSNSKIGKTKKLWMSEMGNPTGEERGVPASYSRRSGF